MTEETTVQETPVYGNVSVEELEKPEYDQAQYDELMALYEESVSGIKEGQIVKGTVVSIGPSEVIVDIGFKSEGAVPIKEFSDLDSIEEGQEIEVFLEDIEDQEGQVVLSKQKADFMRVWDLIKDAHDTGNTVEGQLTRRIKGGIVVNLFGVEAFLPGSQIDIRQVKNFDQFIGHQFPFKIIKLNKARRNIVVSRRAVLEEERARMREEIVKVLEEDQVREGVVKNITDFGAFIDLGGVDGLLHITDMSWGRINHPSELVNIGDRIKVKVISYDRKRERISLGLKQLTAHPWENIENKYPIESQVRGKVVSITDYGAFVELEEGIEGLVHISEMSWTQHVRHPSKLVNIGDIVEVKVLKIDSESQKISLGMKQTEEDPWDTLDTKYPPGTKVEGTVCSLTNFGVFVEIEENIDGLVHISDMSWTKRIRQASEIFKKGDVIPVVVTEIDIKRRRISLSHKDAFENPWPRFAEQYAVGVEMRGPISRLLERGVVVSLADEVDGFVPLSHLAIEGLQIPRQSFAEGQQLPLEVIEFDKNQKKIVLSVREYFKDKDQAEYEAYLAEHPLQEVANEAEEEEADKDDEMESWGEAHDAEQDVQQDVQQDDEQEAEQEAEQDVQQDVQQDDEQEAEQDAEQDDEQEAEQDDEQDVQQEAEQDAEQDDEQGEKDDEQEAS